MVVVKVWNLATLHFTVNDCSYITMVPPSPTTLSYVVAVKVWNLATLHGSMTVVVLLKALHVA